MIEDRKKQLDDLVERYWQIFGAIQRQAMSEWLNLELSIAQFKLLFILAFMGPKTIGEAAEILGVGLPTASHLVEKLVQVGMAERINDPHDRRYIRARLTATGYETALRLRQGRHDQLRKWVAQLGETDFAALQQGLHALRQIAEADILPVNVVEPVQESNKQSESKREEK